MSKESSTLIHKPLKVSLNKGLRAPGCLPLSRFCCRAPPLYLRHHRSWSVSRLHTELPALQFRLAAPEVCSLPAAFELRHVAVHPRLHQQLVCWGLENTATPMLPGHSTHPARSHSAFHPSLTHRVTG